MTEDYEEFPPLWAVAVIIGGLAVATYAVTLALIFLLDYITR